MLEPAVGVGFAADLPPVGHDCRTGSQQFDVENGSPAPSWSCEAAGRHLSDTDEEGTMPRFMLLQNYEGGAGCEIPMYEWEPQDVAAHIRFQVDLNARLVASGELVDAQGLAGPDLAKVVTADGLAAPVVTDGPYLEAKEFLAGYRIVDVESLDRALEIAATASAAPGAKGVPIVQPIEVRQIMAAPEPGA